MGRAKLVEMVDGGAMVRSETHRSLLRLGEFSLRAAMLDRTVLTNVVMGFAALYPSYGLPQLESSQ